MNELLKFNDAWLGGVHIVGIAYLIIAREPSQIKSLAHYAGDMLQAILYQTENALVYTTPRINKQLQYLHVHYLETNESVVHTPHTGETGLHLIKLTCRHNVLFWLEPLESYTKVESR